MLKVKIDMLKVKTGDVEGQSAQKLHCYADKWGYRHQRQQGWLPSQLFMVTVTEKFGA